MNFCQSHCVRKQDLQDTQDVQDKRYLFCGRALWLTENLFILAILSVLAILLQFRVTQREHVMTYSLSERIATDRESKK